jgi:alanyl-tRNA synthetase
MQQHTGQHLLSQAFLRAREAATIGFHLGTEVVTIDLDLEKLDPARAAEAERIANQAVIADHAVRAWFPDPGELAQLALRKTPEVDGPLRVVAIGDFDFNACGGTHVAHSGEVGPIKITRVEKQKKGVRVEFVCGQRAFGDYARKHEIVARLASDFTCGQAQVLDAVARLRDENQALRKDLRAAREVLLDHEARSIREGQAAGGGLTVVRAAWPDRDASDLRGLATRLAASPGVVALLGASGAKTSFVFARAGDVDRDMNGLLRSALSRIASAKGGGSPAIAQGGGGPASLEEVQSALDHAHGELMKTSG